MLVKTDISDGDVVRHKSGGPCMTVNSLDRKTGKAYGIRFRTVLNIEMSEHQVLSLEKITTDTDGRPYPQEREQIYEGDVVYLRSGSPRMVVVKIDYWTGTGEQAAMCEWMTGDKKEDFIFGFTALTKTVTTPLVYALVRSSPTKKVIIPSPPTIALPTPVEITNSLKKFKSVYPDPTKAAFIMMKYGKTQAHSDIAPTIKAALKSESITGMRVDERAFHTTDLYWNIVTYMHGCGFGIAVFERIESDDFNANVAFEAGYMMALGKPVLLLKDKTVEKLHADLDGKLYKTFDTRDQKKTIPGVIKEWLQDNDLTALATI
jgi:uncharacterized protein YodC (DUF2158 family)/nucleoside 2-deoxyribosyltransferase